MSLANVQAFYDRLTSDEVFRLQIQGVETKEECSQIVQGAGYYFSQEELEEFTAQLLESTTDEEAIKDIDKEEMAAVVGGITTSLLSGSINPLPPYGLPPNLWRRLLQP
jgi:predicted ribosomally synthesized peptide with nif11-like leader